MPNLGTSLVPQHHAPSLKREEDVIVWKTPSSMCNNHRMLQLITQTEPVRYNMAHTTMIEQWFSVLV